MYTQPIEPGIYATSSQRCAGGVEVSELLIGGIHSVLVNHQRHVDDASQTKPYPRTGVSKTAVPLRCVPAVNVPKLKLKASIEQADPHSALALTAVPAVNPHEKPAVMVKRWVHREETPLVTMPLVTV